MEGGGGYYPQDLATVIQNILTNTTQPFVETETTDNELECSPQEWCDTETDILVTICGHGAGNIALSGTDIAARLGYLHVAFQSTGTSDVACNWRFTDEAPGAFVAGNIRYVGSRVKESWYVQASKSNCSNVDNPVGWQASGLVRGPESGTLKDINYSCVETDLKYPSEVLTWGGLNQTSHNIGIGLVKPVWDYAYQYTSGCGQHYCDPATNVLVSICGHDSEEKRENEFVTRLLNGTLQTIQDRAGYYEHTAPLNPCLQLTPLPGITSTSTKKHKNWILNMVNPDEPKPSVSARTLDAGQTCDQFLSRIQPDPSPAPAPKSTNALNPEFKEWLVYEPPQDGGFHHTDVLKLKDQFTLVFMGDDAEIASVPIFRGFKTRSIGTYDTWTENDCYFWMCLDQTNIVVRLCGLWYPESGLAVWPPTDYENKPEKDLESWAYHQAIIGLWAFLCTPDGIGQPVQETPSSQSDGKIDGKVVLCDGRFKLTKATQVDRALLFSDTYRAVLRQYSGGGTLIGPAVFKIENIVKSGVDICDKRAQGIVSF
ncbi:hypothetical protein AA313_de0208910 [Arthrobotrys entomopaga]|nr:hypothetical protein AA313_de0208910 [Arthrobotrys entomopaga]